MTGEEGIVRTEGGRAEDVELLYDALRFARDEFRDENGLPWSNEEYARLQAWIDRLEPLVEAAIK